MVAELHFISAKGYANLYFDGEVDVQPEAVCGNM